MQIRNVMGIIEIRGDGFKLTYPASASHVVAGAVAFAASLPAETLASTKRRKRAFGAKAKPEAAAVAVADEVDVQPAEPKAKVKKAKESKASPVVVPQPATPTATGTPKCADVVAKALAEGVSSKTEIYERLRNAGQRPGPIAIYFAQASKRGEIVVKDDTVSLPS